jgi:hypothetical protein
MQAGARALLCVEINMRRERESEGERERSKWHQLLLISHRTVAGSLLAEIENRGAVRDRERRHSRMFKYDILTLPCNKYFYVYLRV